MKRKITFLLLWGLMILSLQTLAQPLYKFRVQMKESTASRCTNRNWVQVQIQTTDSVNYSTTGLYQYGTDIATWWDSFTDGGRSDALFDGSQNLTSITVRTQCYGSCQTFFWSCGANNSFIYNKTYTDIANMQNRTSRTGMFFPLSPGGIGDPSGSYPVKFNSDPSLDDWIQVIFYPSNLDILDHSNRVLLLNDTTTISATAGFPADAYTWKYKIDGVNSNFIDMPAMYQGKSTISVKGSDLLGTAFDTTVTNGRQVNILVYAKDVNSNLVPYGTQKTLTPKFYAPRIVSAIGQPALCSDSKTTTALIKFDKPIGAGNQLLVSNYSSLNSADSWIITDDSLDASLQYTLKNLPVNRSFGFKVVHYYDKYNQSLESEYFVTPTLFNYSTALFPTPVYTKLLGDGIYCNGGKDGVLLGYAQGGTPPYRMQYSTKSGSPLQLMHTNMLPSGIGFIDANAIGGIGPGSYKLVLMDRNGCTISDSIALTQPSIPVTLTEKLSSDATGYGLSNGSIKVRLNGGTLSPPPSAGPNQGYPLAVVTNSKGQRYTGTFTNQQSNGYGFVFNQLPAGNYQFIGEDYNLTTYHSSFKDSLGCLATSSFTILQPPPLLVNLVQQDTIVCYADQTASLIAHATGGKPFVSTTPYRYQWSYSIDGILAYTDLVASDSVLSSLGSGFYQVKVMDSNGNFIIGSHFIKQPSKVTYGTKVKNVTCLNWTDGSASVFSIHGGTGPYRVLWNDGFTDTLRVNLAKGTYTVTIHDAWGCLIKTAVVVKDTLNDMSAVQRIHQMPYCYGDSNGVLAVQVRVGSPPYTLLWNTGSTDSLLSHIKAGTYTLQIRDNKNCLKQDSFVLNSPPAIPLNLDKERYLCIDQSADYNIAVKDSIYRYSWQGPGYASIDSLVSLTAAGLYTASISDKRGCKVKDSVSIYRVSESIESEFVVTSEIFVGDQVLMTNITQDAYLDTAYWQITDPNIEIVSLSYAYATVIFKKAGVYTVGLNAHLGNCVKQNKKTVQVLDPTFDHKPYQASSPFIVDFEIRPNPNNGKFEVMIKLQDIASVKLRFLDFYSDTSVSELELSDAKEYLVPMQVNVAPGSYVLFLETPYGTRVTKVVISN